MPKILSIPEAVAKVQSGNTVMIGGFMTCGAPVNLIAELARRGVHDLTLISNDTGVQGDGVGMLISADAVTKLIASHIGTNPETGRRMIDGRLSVELVPQGTLAERNPLRRSGARGSAHTHGSGDDCSRRKTGVRH